MSGPRRIAITCIGLGGFGDQWEMGPRAGYEENLMWLSLSTTAAARARRFLSLEEILKLRKDTVPSGASREGGFGLGER